MNQINKDTQFLDGLDIFDSEGIINFNLYFKMVEDGLTIDDFNKILKKNPILENTEPVSLIEDFDADGIKDILFDYGKLSNISISFQVLKKDDNNKIYDIFFSEPYIIGAGKYSWDEKSEEIVFTSWTFKDKRFEKDKEILIPRYYFEARFKMVGDKIIEVQPPKKIMIENGKPEIEGSPPPPAPPGQEKKQ